jgi:hypothetical protein
MASKKQTWKQKLEKESSPKVKHIEKRFVDIPENSDMLVATPKIFEDYLKKIKPGTEIPIKKVRQDLAKKFKADHTCPVTTGLFLRIVAEANYEKLQMGVNINEIAPFWRVIDLKSSIAKKLSFPLDFIREMREKEGLID